MELKEFVKQTIIQITDGIRDGHKYISENNFGEGVNDSQYIPIKFDIAVSTNEEEKTGIGGKVSVARIFSAGANNEETNKSSNQSRIEFQLHVAVKTKK